MPEAQQLLDDAVGVVDARQDARRVLPHGGGVGRRASQQMGVHADGAVVARHLVEDGRRRLADRGEPLAAIELVARGEQVLAPPFALEPRVVEPLQDARGA